MIDHKAEISINEVLTGSQLLVERYLQFVKHTPKMVRDSMTLAYTTAIDDMLKLLDKSKTVNPIVHEERSKVTLLDEHGHAT